MLQSQLKKGFFIYKLASTFKRMPHLDIAELLQFHLVFDAFSLSKEYYDIFEAIFAEICQNAEEISASFELDSAQRQALMHLARSNRKWFGTHKAMGQALASRAYAGLLKQGWLFVEPSLEKKKQSTKHQRLCRHERRKLIQDKLHFTSHFVRFFFYFIEPYLAKSQKGINQKAMQSQIQNEFLHYCSLGFERLACELVAKTLQTKASPTSLWIDRQEIDIFYKDQSQTIVGEAKFRQKKLCKSVLTQLEYKCKLLGITPTHTALVSLNGFSKELNEMKNKGLLLLQANDFKRLINE